MLLPFPELISKYGIAPRGVLHLGSNTGQEAEWYSSCGVRNVLWVEALNDVYEQLVKNVSIYEGNTTLHACISDVDGEIVQFNVSSNEGQSSSILEFGTHAIVHDNVKYIGKEQKITTRMDTALEWIDFRDQDYDFLNIDLQGYELKALKGLGRYLNGFRYCYIEVNQDYLYQGCPLKEEIYNYLGHFGFTLKEELMTNFQWGDAFLMR